MSFLKIIRHVLLTLTFATISLLTNASPLVFNFTGTVSDQYLDELMHDTPLSIPEWNGKNISGSFTMDLDATEPAAQFDYFTWYSTYDPAGVATRWLKFTVTHPDGSTSLFPAEDPTGPAYTNFSTTVINGDPDNISSFFDVVRLIAYTEGNDYGVEMSLGAHGENSSLIYSSYDFNTIEFHPEFANEVNRALVKYDNELGEKIEYNFLITSITRVKSEVPESGNLALMLLGIAGLILNRRRMEK